ncbi:MAG TPA: AmmeMemoRadiSam system protein B [Sedimentisphaerales bacterium]|nr:AmmeMemoRadiSam system protein B [Sedimentisphaerales bacterium]
MQTRKPIVAGQFYPGQHDACNAEIHEFLDEMPPHDSLPDTIVAGIVPHAGWVFSGALAAMVFAAIRQRHEKVNTFVIFGAAHNYFGDTSAVCAGGVWLTPLGQAVVDEELAQAVLSGANATEDFSAHAAEHSIEVQIPLIQDIFPGAKILPILVPPREQAVALGGAVGRIIERTEQKKIVCIGSTDLTHYGPSYGFTPMGIGKSALQWAKEVNDRKFIDLALRMDPHGLLAAAAENCNACGAGAAAATIAAAKHLGKTAGTLLAHTTSSEIMLEKMKNTSRDSVGYAAIIF